MKKIKKILALCLAASILLECGNLAAFAENPRTHQQDSEDGYLYTYNDDGTITMTIYPSGGSKKESASAASEDDRLEDQGDSYVNTSDDVTVTLEKTYSDGDVLVSVESDGTGIVFYPETVAGAIPVENTAAEEALHAEDSAEQAIETPPQEAVSDAPSQDAPESADEEQEAGTLSAGSSYHGVHLAPLALGRSVPSAMRLSANPEESDPPAETPEPTETPLLTATPVPTEIPLPKETSSSTEASEPTDDFSGRQEQDAPEAPKVEAVSPNCIKVLDPQTDQEYSINNGLTWVTADENGEVRFENLTPETEYEVITRKLGNDAFLPSPASAPAKVTTPAETPEATPEPTETPLPTPEPTSTPEPTPTPTPLPSETPAVTAEPEPQYEPATVYGSVDGVGTGYADGTYAGVLYPGAINEFTDVELIPTGNGVKENIIMRRYTTPEISYVLDFSGLSPVLSGNTVLLYDASGEKVGEISAPYLVDANRAYNKDIGVSLNHIGSGYRLTYTMDESWLMAAAYPVTLDPSVTFTVPDDTWNYIEDNYVTLSQPGVNHDYRNKAMRCNSDNIPYIRPVFPDSIKELGNYLLIKNVTMYTYVLNVYSAGTFSAHPVLGGDWRSTTITASTAPVFGPSIQNKYISSTGYVAWDITEAASTWFNALNQLGNYGVAITGTGDINIHSSDDWTELLYYEITYYPNPPDPGLQISAHGNALNSGTGYLNLSWNAVEGASTYYVGIHNGRNYEYLNVGNVTSWTTQGKGIWPTESEIQSGRYLLHWNGAGAELPMIPAFTYNNSGGELANNVNYYVCVVPANQYGQAPNPKYFGVRYSRLPDTLPPSTAGSLSVSPDSYTNASTVTLNWSGIRDFNATDTQAVASLGSGRVQYSLNSTGNWTNTASSSGDGSAGIDVSSIPDGQNVVYLRAVDSAGNTGTPQPVYFFIDRTPPTAPTISIVPNGWSKDDSLSLTWSGINDLNELARVELSFDGGAYFSTGRNEPAYSGHMVDLSSLPDGEHTLSVRGVDIAGNNGEAATVTFYRDTTAPTTAETSVEPDSWTNSDEVTFGWTQLEDIHSGLKLVWYRLNSGDQISLATEEDLTTALDVSDLSDGEHTILLHFEDQVGNSAEHSLSVFRDVTKPELALLSPADGSAVNGTVEVLGSVRDLSLDTWKLTATGESGEARTLAVGSAEKDAELLGILNCALYADGEKVELKLYAIDKAGNENEVTGTVIVVDKSAKPISGTVTITAPASNEQLTAPDTTGSYTTAYEQPETEGLLYIDGVYQGTTKDKTFPFDTITYAENSVHSLSVLSRASDGTVQFSQGVYNYVLHSDAFEDDSFLSSHSGIAFHYGAALDGAASGTLISQPVTPAFPVLSLRLSVTEDKPAGTDIQYYYSTDSGETWTPISPETDVPMLSRPETVMLKAELTGDGTSTPTLYGMTLQGVIEMEPTRVIVKLLRPVEQIALADTTVTQAITPLAEAPEAAEQLRQYRDGAYMADSFSYDARGVAENESRRVALAAETKDHVLHGSGAKTSILLRENVTASGTVESGALTADGSIYALRLEALYSGGTKFSYSTDGTSWASLTPGAYTYLDKPAEAVYVRARGGTLRAWHVEGVTCAESTVTVRIMQAPANVTAADWGAEYYANEKLRYYDLSWTDPTPEDTSAAYTTAYEIYRNGALIATTAETRYRDNNYVANARYEVRTLRTYAGFEARPSERSAAVRTSMKAPERTLGVSYTAEEQKQSEYLNRLYGGNYTFSSQPKAPTDGRALNRGLLGRNKLCAYGFEPVNFNTGNFLLETADYALADLGLASFALDRTYNAQSEAANGPFGSRWSSTWSEHLLLYTEGDVTYTKADGAEIVFHRRANGSYYGGEAYGLTLTAEGGEYRVADLNGETHAFTGMGLLKHVQWSDGSRIELLRDADGLLTAFVLPSGETLAVENDKYGHITAVETPSGTLRYTYSGNLLTRFTDADGSETRYVYDGSGRMTEWYDAEGARQVKNTYDKEGRVTRQLDANGGEYRLEYFDDHTVTTDADGKVSEVWYDELKRTTKTVDAQGAAVKYDYDANSNIVAITDALGNVTRYEYDAFGNKVKETAPDGSSYSLQYDANNKLTQLTDQRGGVTRYEYDEHNRLVKQTNPDGGVIAYTYNEAGQVLTVTDPLGHVKAYEYDGADLVKSTDPNGNVTSYTYDGQHRLIATTDALGNTTAFAYDGQDNLISVTFADGTSFAYEFDKVGNLTSQTDAEGNTTRFEYDALRQLVKTIYPDGSESTSTYDHSGNLLAAIDALGGEATAAYDGRGRISTLTDALGNTTAYTYDLNGNLTSETLADGEEIGYTYDSVGRLAEAETSEGEIYRYAYDKAGNLISYTDADGAVTRFGYDAMGRLLSETDPNGAATTYAYDKAGRLTTKEDADGVSLYRFDPNGNLLTITDQATGEELFRYEYDALDRLTAVYDGEGLIAAYAYTALGVRYEVTEAEEAEAVRSGGTPYGLRPYFPALRTVPIRETDGGGTPFNKTKAFQSYLSQAASAAEQAKKSARLASASASAAEGYAPGSAAAREAQEAYIQAKQAANRAQANYTALKAATTKAAADQLLAAVQSNARAASQAEAAARVCCDRAASRNAPKSTPAAPTPRTAPKLNGHTTAQTPAVQSPEEGNAACSSWWDRLAQGETARFQQQQIENAAMTAVLLGAINSFGRNGIDTAAGLSRFLFPQNTYRINSNSARWKENLESFTRELIDNDIAYDAGQLAGDAATTFLEYYLAVKAAKGVYGAIKNAPEILSTLYNAGKSLVPAMGPPIEPAVAVAGTVAESGTLVELLALFGDVFFNRRAFMSDWDTLKEDLEASNSTEEYTIKQGSHADNNPLEHIEYTEKVKAQMEQGDYHSFPREVESFGDLGKTKTITGGDGINRTLVEIEGSYNGVDGVFQFIIEPDGITCNHRLFVPFN